MTEIIYIIFISMLPVVELRGSIPIGIEMGLPVIEVWLFAVLGNIIPIIPILVLFQPISNKLMKYKWYNRFYNWLHVRTMKRGQEKLDKYGAIGLFLLTAIPLPTTGAWTASFLATFLRVKIKYAFIAISLGVIVAGIIVVFLSDALL